MAKDVTNDREKAILAQNPHMHWSDVMMMAEKSHTVDLRDLIQARLGKICAEHIAKSDNMRPHSPADSLAKPLAGGFDSLNKFSGLSPSPKQSTALIPEGREGQDGDAEIMSQEGIEEEPEESKTPQMNTEEFVLQYGPETMAELSHLLAHSFKVFWDGSISLYKDTVTSSTNNKEFLNKLLDIRMASDQHQEPPVTLIHGHETEVTLRETLMRIKVEQAEELERMKQKALA